MTAQQFMHPLQHTKHTYQYISLNLILWEIYFHSIHNEVIHVDSISYRLNQTQFTISACRMCRAGQKIFPSLQDDGTRFCRNQPIRLLVSAMAYQPANSVFLSQSHNKSAPAELSLETNQRVYTISARACISSLVTMMFQKGAFLARHLHHVPKRRHQ